uniref:BRCT domain-containing protein n=1 Tax=Caenorhabditis tropicalis TaxID=1561998 RepID=A0A1I7U3H8_9PELO
MDRSDGKNVLIDAVREINPVNLLNAVKKGAYIDVCNRFPDHFPFSSFHIFIEERTDDTLTNEFTAMFQSITSDEIMPTTTHCIVKTGQEDIFETDDINLLSWIFNGVIIVKESWMTDCLKNKKLISKDCNYLVEKVKFKGIVYDTVLQWSNAMAKGTIPYLYGVHVVMVMKQCPNVTTLVAIITNQGGTILDKFPEKENYNRGAHPYLHNNLGPIFLIHDGTVDLKVYQNDPDRLFTIFTETELLMFLLKREININTNPNPVPILVDGDD